MVTAPKKGVTTPEDIWDETNLALHEKALYPTIRVRAGNHQGSGTIIYCGERTEPDEDGELGFSTYALTNHHVVSSAIRVEKTYDPQVGKYRTRDYRDLVQVEVFSYKNRSTITARTTAEAEIMAYHEKRDVALLRLKTNQKFDYVAKLLPAERGRDVHIFDKLYIVGCGLGQPPFPTSGMLTGKDVQIDYYPYWQTSAPSIFGNSGGAVFLGRSLDMMGIPSRISVSGTMFARDAITHIGYFCPPGEIHKFIKDQGFFFLTDPSHSEADDLKALAERDKGEDGEENGD
jgi:S1-C subfamily serine protease